MDIGQLTLWMGLAGIGLAAGLLALRHPSLLVALSVYTVSLDFYGRIEGTLFTANNLLKVVLIAVFAVQMATGDRRLRIPRHLLWFLPFLIFAGLSSFYSADLPKAGFFVLRFGMLWVFAVLVANLIEEQWQLLALLVAIVGTALVVSVAAHLQTLNALTMAGVSFVQKQGPDAGSVRALGTFWDANSMGGFLAVLSLFMVAALSLPQLRWLWKACILAVLTITVGAILLSYSRSAWLILVLGILAFWRDPRLRPYAKWFLAVGLVGVVYLAVATPYGRVLLNRALSFGALEQDYSSRFRLYLALSGLQIWATGMHWLWGGGFYSYSSLVGASWYPLATHDMIFHSGTHMSHTLVVTLLADGGLIGLTLYCVAYFAAFRELGRLRRQALSPVARIAVNACAVVLFVKVADTFFNPHMYDQLVWMTLGLIGALGSRSFAAAPALGSDPEQR
jgi:hypothetical protein